MYDGAPQEPQSGRKANVNPPSCPILDLVRSSGEETAEVNGNAPNPGQRQTALLPHFRRQSDCDEYLSWLHRRIVRNPRDLLSHSQRIMLSHQQENTKELVGALLDLFIATSNDALDLRRSLLALVRDGLDREHFVFFLRHLQQGLGSSDSVPESSHSLLVTPIEGTTDLVIRMDQTEDSPPPLLEQAYEQLQLGNTDKGRRYLELALQHDPGDPLVSMELLAIYKHQGLRQDFYRTYTELSGRKLAFPELWKQLDTRFSEHSH